jgi:hypothetical protein
LSLFGAVLGQEEMNFGLIAGNLVKVTAQYEPAVHRSFLVLILYDFILVGFIVRRLLVGCILFLDILFLDPYTPQDGRADWMNFKFERSVPGRLYTPGRKNSIRLLFSTF